ncbi:MAG: MBOAT family protein [Pirellulaceae bacterium]|jgi:alginate O-acetyltransferase complex protein AlgI|nr:MBOAT family protein [Pirellulaceae bacterium]MDP7018845.1 MBOAT family protein [Pirellulaceae bacterium]
MTEKSSRAPWIAWTPAITTTGAAFWFSRALPEWLAMWALAAGMYFGFKLMTLRDFTARVSSADSLRRAWEYTLLWPGMDLNAFFRRVTDGPQRREWVLTLLQTGLGAALLVLADRLVSHSRIAAGWCAMAGILLVLHCGLIRLLALAWRRLGADVAPIMNRPAAARTISEFWSRRWNLAFRDLAHRFVFRPAVRRCGARWATAFVFLFSGVVHELGVSLPARGGWGLPTLYFSIQGAAVLLQHSDRGRRWALDRGVTGRAFAWLVVVAPVGLLFHTRFIERVVLPFLAAVMGVFR